MSSHEVLASLRSVGCCPCQRRATSSARARAPSSGAGMHVYQGQEQQGRHAYALSTRAIDAGDRDSGATDGPTERGSVALPCTLRSAGQLERSTLVAGTDLSRPAPVTGAALVPLDDPLRLPDVGATDRAVGCRHLLPDPVRRHRLDADAQVVRDVGSRPPVGVRVGRLGGFHGVDRLPLRYRPTLCRLSLDKLRLGL